MANRRSPRSPASPRASTRGRSRHTELARWYLTADGSLATEAPVDDARVEYLALPDSVPATFYDGDSERPVADRRPVGLAGARTRHGGVVRLAPAGGDHRDGRLRLGRPVGQLQPRRHRSRGDAVGDPARRAGDVRAVGMAARQPPGARRGGVHRATAGAHAPRSRRRAAARRRRRHGLRAGPRRDLPVRPRVPRRFADPHLDRRTGRQPGGVGVRDDRQRRTRPARHRRRLPVVGRPPGHSRHRGAR